MENLEDQAKSVKLFEEKGYSVLAVSYVFDWMLRYNWHLTGSFADFKPTSSKAVGMLEKLMDELKT